MTELLLKHRLKRTPGQTASSRQTVIAVVKIPQRLHRAFVVEKCLVQAKTSFIAPAAVTEMKLPLRRTLVLWGNSTGLYRSVFYPKAYGGHATSSEKTTEKYLHVSKRKLVNIVSPLDDLMDS